MSVKTTQELTDLMNDLAIEQFNRGLEEDCAEERLAPIMQQYFAGVSYKEVRELIEERYPERFI